MNMPISTQSSTELQVATIVSSAASLRDVSKRLRKMARFVEQLGTPGPSGSSTLEEWDQSQLDTFASTFANMTADLLVNETSLFLSLRKVLGYDS